MKSLPNMIREAEKYLGMALCLGRKFPCHQL